MPIRVGQLPLRERLRRLESWTIVGRVPVEHNNEASYVIAADGSRWVMKAVEVSGPNQLLAEAISNQLAEVLGLPVPIGAIGGTGSSLAWFSEVVEHAAHFSPARLALTDNHADFGRIIPLDVWVINEDRHAGNILLVGAQTVFLPRFIDFGSAMVGYPNDFSTRIDYVPREREFAPRAVASELLLAGAHRALADIAALSEDDIRGIVEEACLAAGFSDASVALADALLERRGKLPALVGSFLARLGVTP